ncbi:hypothetical protein SAMN05443667_104125 [Flavobacterium gillisiae]|uniref:Uncharacterized protein n=1 Tax=Flavobacterium gillisiae TaxID=150146 RepID=A0A1H4B0F6_9FLAO|nr:hypothetical protein [Flavobacterium gillisiae]SEA41528.1 hypothetical protein SAMN05443667_104125 [Flavobacterium gillisiae]
MKNSKRLWMSVLVIVFTVVFFSCKNNKAEKVEEVSTMEEVDTASTAFMPFKVIVIKHDVAGYNKWRLAYDAHDSVRMTYGISHFVIGRGMDNPNTIMVIDKMDDVNKAKDFSMLPSLKDAMKKAGVLNTPKFGFYEVIRNDNSKINLKDRLMVTHRVKDFDAWLKVYDEEGIIKRMEGGLIDRGMARNIDDPNIVTIVFAISDIDKAKALIKSEEQKKVMMDAGVEGVPEMFFYKLVE